MMIRCLLQLEDEMFTERAGDILLLKYWSLMLRLGKDGGMHVPVKATVVMEGNVLCVAGLKWESENYESDCD